MLKDYVKKAPLYKRITSIRADVTETVKPKERVELFMNNCTKAMADFEKRLSTVEDKLSKQRNEEPPKRRRISTAARSSANPSCVHCEDGFCLEHENKE